MTKGAGPDSSGLEGNATTAGETKHRCAPAQEGDTPKGMTNAARETKAHGEPAQESDTRKGITNATGETKAHGEPARESNTKGMTNAAGKAKAHGEPAQVDLTPEGMTNEIMKLFPRDPLASAGHPRERRFVEENLQTPGQPALPYVELDERFIAAGEKEFIIKAFCGSWDKLMPGET
jgi:hypothetical protein